MSSAYQISRVNEIIRRHLILVSREACARIPGVVIIFRSWSMYGAGDFEEVWMSSEYNRARSHAPKESKTSIARKISGDEFRTPNGKRTHLQCPWCEVRADMSRSSLLIRACQYPPSISNVKKIVALSRKTINFPNSLWDTNLFFRGVEAPVVRIVPQYTDFHCGKQFWSCWFSLGWFYDFQLGNFVNLDCFKISILPAFTKWSLVNGSHGMVESLETLLCDVIRPRWPSLIFLSS